MNLQSTSDFKQLIQADCVALLADGIETAAINGQLAAAMRITQNFAHHFAHQK